MWVKFWIVESTGINIFNVDDLDLVLFAKLWKLYVKVSHLFIQSCLLPPPLPRNYIEYYKVAVR